MEQDVIVVGAGISGLSLAQRCARGGLRVLVLERTATPGGCVQTHRVEGGYWHELGAHTAYNSYGQMLAMIEEGPGLGSLLPRAKAPFRLLVDGKIRSVTSQLSILQLLVSAPRILTTRKEGATVRQYYSRLVGDGNYDRVFGPLFAAVPSQPADDFPAEMLFKPRPRRKDVPRSFSMTGGLQGIIDALAATPNVTVRCGVEVSGVQRDEHGFTVSVVGGSAHAAPYAAIASGPPVASSMLATSFPAVSAALARIRAVTVSTTGVVVRKADTTIGPVAGIIPLDGRFFSAVSRDTVPDENWRGFAFHARPGTTLDERLGVIANTLQVPRDKLQHVVERQVTLPSPTLGHDAVVADIVRGIEGTPLFLTGNYFGGLALEDCVIRSRVEAGRLLELHAKSQRPQPG